MATIDFTQLPPPVPLYGKIKDISNTKVHRWNIKYFVYALKRVSYWVCQCDCGNYNVVAASHLKRNRSKSCGCWSKDNPVNVQHGLCDTTEAKSYYHMRARCTDASHVAWQDYGGRGITICDRWLNGDGTKYGVECFVEDMGIKPPKHSIDRIDNEKGYWCGKCLDCIQQHHIANCRWATKVTQANNTRTNVLYTYQNRTQTMSEWATEKGFKPPTIWNRPQLGWSFEKAITTPLRINRRWHSST